MNHMPYLIDGHNLIPKIPGLSLAEIDDELHLVDLLQDFCRRTQKRVEVYFDNALPDQPPARSYGNVLARFVRQGSSADRAIRDRLRRLGREARNWTVVSSDREVQAAARAARAEVITSEDFAALLQGNPARGTGGSGARPDGLAPEEVDAWMDFFGFDDESSTGRDRHDRAE